MDATLYNSIVELVMVILGLVISRYLIPYLKSKYTAQNISNTFDTVMNAVKAAGKIYEESGQGELRKEYVLDYINNTIKLKISEAQLNVLIESAVKTLDLLEAEIKKKEIATTEVK